MIEELKNSLCIFYILRNYCNVECTYCTGSHPFFGSHAGKQTRDVSKHSFIKSKNHTTNIHKVKDMQLKTITH